MSLSPAVWPSFNFCLIKYSKLIEKATTLIEIEILLKLLLSYIARAGKRNKNSVIFSFLNMHLRFSKCFSVKKKLIKIA